MIQTLRYGEDEANLRLVCRVTRADSPQELSYLLVRLVPKAGVAWPEQHEYLFPGFRKENQASLGWFGTEQEARDAAVKAVVRAFDTFNAWPRYANKPYLPDAETFTPD
jgi:hypothetical protein